jgi:hypothetical protein
MLKTTNGDLTRCIFTQCLSKKTAMKYQYPRTGAVCDNVEIDETMV